MSDVTCDRLSRFGLLAVSLLHWLTAAMMLHERFFPFVYESAPSTRPLLAMLAGWCGLA